MRRLALSASRPAAYGEASGEESTTWPGPTRSAGAGDKELMTRTRIHILAGMALGAILWTNACGDGGTDPRPPIPHMRRW